MRRFIGCATSSNLRPYIVRPSHNVPYRLGEHDRSVTEEKILRFNEPRGDMYTSNRPRPSVKTTAQNAGFLSINERALNQVDDLILLRYDVRDLELVHQ